MPRRGALLTLSHQHHAALLLARAARQAAASASRREMAAMNRRIAEYWRDTLAAHFRAEESLLLQYPEALPAALAMRLLEQHRALAAMCVRAGAGALDAASLRDFSERMAAHVRFEERECFDALQAAEATSA